MSTALAPIDEVRNALTRMSPEFQAVLPAHVSPEKFIRTALTSIRMNPDLLQCDRRSLYGATMKCAQDGLVPDGREAAIVKFGQSAAYMPMVAGILKKVRQSGELLSITSEIVYEAEVAADKFEYWMDETGVHMRHRPILVGTRGEIAGVYAIAKTKDGGVYFEFMTVEDVRKVQACSRAAGNGPWKDWWTEMARKTVVRRLAKRLPMSTDMDYGDSYTDPEIEAATEPTQPMEAVTRSSRLAAVVERQDESNYVDIDPATGEVIHADDSQDEAAQGEIEDMI